MTSGMAHEPATKRRRLENGYHDTDSEPTTPSKPEPLETADEMQTDSPRATNGDSHVYDSEFMARGRPMSDRNGDNSVVEGTDPEQRIQERASSPMIPDDPDIPTTKYKCKMILRGHERAIACVKFSPDGQWIASCSADATIKIWSASSGALQHTMRGHLAGISTIAWAPDSTTLASGSDDKTIRFWNVHTGRPYPSSLIGHNNYIYSLAFSPKGNMLVSGSYDEAVILWDVRSRRLMRTLPAHSDPIGGVDFVRDGTLIASCATDGLIRIWDTGTGQCLKTFFHEDTPPVVSVKFSPNGKYILAWHLDHSVRMWSYVDGRCVKTYQGHRNEKYSMTGTFGTYGYSDAPTAFLASGSESGEVLCWDVVSKRILQRLKGHTGTVFCVDMHPKTKLLVSCAADKTIRLWIDEQDE